MIKKTIKYTDYNGVERNEDFWFNLSKAELAEKELTTPGGYSAMLQAVVDAKDQPTIIKIFKEFVLEAYGERTADGKYFMKVDENGHRLSTKFAQTEAYSELFMALATNDELASEFIKGVMPSDISK